MCKFKVGDRVTRLTDVFNRNSLLKHGVITKLYQYSSKFHGFYPELYQVQWDDGKIEGGFLPHGLNKETLCIIFTPLCCGLSNGI